MKNGRKDLSYWDYESDTYMVKLPFDEILNFKSLLGFKTKKEASSSKFLSNYMVYKQGLRGSPLYIQTQIKRDVFVSFIKEYKKELKENEIEIIKLKQ